MIQVIILHDKTHHGQCGTNPHRREYNEYLLPPSPVGQGLMERGDNVALKLILEGTGKVQEKGKKWGKRCE